MCLIFVTELRGQRTKKQGNERIANKGIHTDILVDNLYPSL